MVMYSCCCCSAYTIDPAPTDAGRAGKISSQRTRALGTRDYTILIAVYFILPITYYISNSTFTPLDKSAIIITHFFSSTKAVTIGTVMICDYPYY